MLDEATRMAILKLTEQGHGSRAIAHTLGISRSAVKAVIESGSAQVPKLSRSERADVWRESIIELHAQFAGHLGRVHEELVRQGAALSYPALTAFCRRHGIGHTPKRPAGRYTFEPGQEMQHDTSPHKARVGGALVKVQTASLVLCYSRMIFFQHYPRFTRFECKHFLTQALVYFGGAAASCMVDNSNVVVASGSGPSMIPAPEMEAFAKRFGFVFKAHAIGDANRSARVEAPFHRIESAFLQGAEFTDWAHLNQTAQATCDDWNARHSNKLHASRRELFAAERSQLKSLPLHIPEVYQLHTRIVDAEGYVHINRIRYSVPWPLIGRPLEVRETMARVEIYQGPRRVAGHDRIHGPPDTRVTDPAHRPPRGQRIQKDQPPPEEIRLLEIEPQLAGYLAGLKAHTGGRRPVLRHLLAMLREYPRRVFLVTLAEAQRYGLYDLTRLEKMVLRNITQEFFILKPPASSDE